MCLCVYVCVHVSVRVRVCVCVCMHVRARLHACVCCEHTENWSDLGNTYAWLLAESLRAWLDLIELQQYV